MTLLLDVAVKVTLLMLATGAVIALMRRASAASRHIALTAALGAAVLLPAAKVALPALPLFVPAPRLQPAEPATAAVFASSPIAPVALNEPKAIVEVDRPMTEAPAIAAVPLSRADWSPSRLLGIVWLSGFAIILLNMAAALVRINALAREARPVDDKRMIEKLAHIHSQFNVRRPVALLVSPREWMPITWGLVRPAILLPASATSWLDEHPARLNAVLVHEMAHIARGDAFAQRISRVAVALFWFNPLVWLAARRARLERERACDDAVLARGLRASDYANDLIELAQTLAVPSRAAASALAMARRSQLEARVGALLEHDMNRRGTSALSRCCAVALVLLTLPTAAAELAARTIPATTGNINDDRPRAEPTPPSPTTVERLAPVRTTAIPGARATAIVVQPAQNDAVQSAQQVSFTAVQQSNWPVERDAMYRLLIERARAIVKDTRTKIEIGTAAAIDVKPSEETLALIERVAAVAATGGCATADPYVTAGPGRCVEGTWQYWPWRGNANSSSAAVAVPTDQQVADAKTRFAAAMRSLDTALVRWNNGLITTAEIDNQLKAALRVLTDMVTMPDPSSFFFNYPNPTARDRASADALYNLLTGRISSLTGDTVPGQPLPNVPFRLIARSGTGTLSDDQIIQSLKDLAAVSKDQDLARANALLELASHYAFTPEMVTLYVAAAKGIASPAEQARVFAQPIRVK